MRQPKEALTKATTALQRARNRLLVVVDVRDVSVSGLKAESTKRHRTKVVRYRINSVSWSCPQHGGMVIGICAQWLSGCYFASAGGDATARLWTTDRPTPVRLFAGHTSDCVHLVDFHPNINYIVTYIVTGSEYKTVRLWNIYCESDEVDEMVLEPCRHAEG